jgi:hypothetical protein
LVTKIEEHSISNEGNYWLIKTVVANAQNAVNVVANEVVPGHV